MVLKNSIVISVMYSVGKTTLANMGNKYDIIDLDDVIEHHNISLGYNESFDEKTNFIRLIDYYIGKKDIILTSVKNYIIKILRDRSIPYVLCYYSHSINSFKECEKRLVSRGDRWLWVRVRRLFFSTIRYLDSDEHAVLHVKINSSQYLSDVIDFIVKRVCFLG